jgi:hypothetical protein
MSRRFWPENQDDEEPIRFIHALPMNYEDDRAEIGFASDFWRARRTRGYGQPRTNALASSRSSEGTSTFVNKAG